jgi:hypothetical protein
LEPEEEDQEDNMQDVRISWRKVELILEELGLISRFEIGFVIS